MGIEFILSVIFIIILIAVLIIIHVCLVRRAFRGHSINLSNPIRAEIIPGLSLDDIKALPSLDCRGNEGSGKALPGLYCRVNEESGPEHDEGSVKCAVCLEGYRRGDKCRVLPECNHMFHCECIDSWLLKNGACPVCRATAKTTQFGQGRSSF